MRTAAPKERRAPTGIAAVNAAKERCDPGGHWFTAEGTYLHVDQHGYPRRMCKQCARDRVRARRDALTGSGGQR